MSRFSYSLDISEELEREKQVKRRIAQQRASRDEEEPVKLDPKFEAELQALAEDKPLALQGDEQLVITPKQDITIKKQEAKVAKKPAKKESKRLPKKTVKKPVKNPVKTRAKKEVRKLKEPRTESKMVSKTPKREEVLMVAKEPESVAPQPGLQPTSMYTEPRTPGEGSGRLIVALLLVSALAIILIYSGLAAEQGNNSDARYAQFAASQGKQVITFDNADSAQQFWLRRVFSTTSEAEAAAVARMVLCDEQELFEDSNPLDFQDCDVSDSLLAVREQDVRDFTALSGPSSCDSLFDVISCDNGYFVDGLRALKGEKAPAHLIAKSGGRYTILDSGNSYPEALVVVSDKKDNFVAYTLSPEFRNDMVLRLFVGDSFHFFSRAYLDHYPGEERVVLYSLNSPA